MAADEAEAMVLTAPRVFARRRFPIPAVGDDDAILRIEACGLCGTDHEQWSGLLWGGFAFIPGHESVGVIESIGEQAAERWGVAAGDRVAVEVFQRCGECRECVAGAARRCRRHGLRDMYGFVDAERPPGLWGGYATHQYLSADTLVVPVPAGLDPVVATLFNPLGAGVRWGATLAGTKPGDAVAILGPGIRGLSAVVAAKEAGAAFVMITGHGPRDRERLDWAGRFGADLAVDAAEADPVIAFREATGQGADIVVDVTAKAPAALTQAVKLARPGGAVVVAGTRGIGATTDLDPDLLVYKELRVLGALGVDTAAYEEAFRLLDAGRYPFAAIPRSVVGLDDVGDLLAVLAGESEDAPPLHGVVAP